MRNIWTVPIFGIIWLLLALTVEGKEETSEHDFRTSSLYVRCMKNYIQDNSGIHGPEISLDQTRHIAKAIGSSPMGRFDAAIYDLEAGAPLINNRLDEKIRRKTIEDSVILSLARDFYGLCIDYKNILIQAKEIDVELKNCIELIAKLGPAAGDPTALEKLTETDKTLLWNQRQAARRAQNAQIDLKENEAKMRKYRKMLLKMMTKRELSEFDSMLLRTKPQ